MAAYDTARLIVQALQATGGNTGDKAALADAMRATRFDGPRGPFRIDPGHQQRDPESLHLRGPAARGTASRPVVQEVIPHVQDAPNGCSL